MAGLNNNHISSITITDGDEPTSVGDASRSEEATGPVIVSETFSIELHATFAWSTAWKT